MRRDAPKEPDHSFGSLKSFRKNPCKALGDFQTTIFITRAPPFLRRSAFAAGAAACDQQKCHQKQQRPRWKNRSDQNTAPQSNCQDPKDTAVRISSAKHTTHLPSLLQYIIARLSRVRKKSPEAVFSASGDTLFLSPFLPILDGFQFFMETQIALMPFFLNLSGLQGLQNRAAFFLGVTAAHKAAFIQIGRKFDEGLRQMVLPFQIQILRLKGGESRRIHDLRAAAQAEQFHMAGGVPSSAKGCADLAHLEGKARLQRIQNTGFSYAGVTCKGR